MKILLINQAFFPDVVATAQLLTDLAIDLARSGHQVTVLAGRRSYSSPEQLYNTHEIYQGVKIIRVWSFPFDRKYKILRIFDALFLNLFFAVHLLRRSRFDHVVAMTTPPLVSWFTLHFARCWRSRFIYWMMDINPDQAIQAGWIRQGGFLARLLERILKDILKRSDKIVVLDRFMRENVIRKGASSEKVEIIPPWVLDEFETIPKRQNHLRTQLHLDGVFVVMYSGNHSICHPLDTVLQAALVLKEDPSIRFMFVGGGVRMKEVVDFKVNRRLSNIMCLPYQERANLKDSLSTADLHLVVMGNPFVGIVHPSKVYGILDSARPFVFIGPSESPIGELIQETQIGRQIEHGDVEGLVQVIRSAQQLCDTEREEIAQKSRDLVKSRFDHQKLISRLAQIISNSASQSEG